MTEEEFFRRQDAREAELKDRMLSVEEHMRRGNAIMKRSDETMRLNREEARLNRQAIGRCDETMRETNQIHRDTRTFIREMTLQMRHYMQGLERRAERMEGSLTDLSIEIKANTVVLSDLKLATAQHTQAIARMLDRFD